MSSIKFTAEQSKAIETNNCDILVAAAAGSGKTAVLVERIIKMVTDIEKPVNIDELLIVTFTKAAASEMRQKIANAIIKKLDSNPDNEHLQNQIMLLNKASITTIDSFCTTVVRRNFNSVGIDPNFRIADNIECEIIKTEILDELFEQMYSEENNQEFLDLVESFCSNVDDSRLADIVLDIYKFIQSAPYPEKWIHENVEKFNLSEEDDIFDTDWTEIIKSAVRIDLDAAKMQAESIFDFYKSTKEISIGYEKALIDDINTIDTIINLFEYDIKKFFKVFADKINFTTLKSSKKNDTLSLDNKEKIKNQRKELKASITNFQNKIINLSPLESKEYIRKVYPIMKTLGDVIIKFDEAFKAAKKEKNIVDFSDIEHFCIDILLDESGNHTPAANELQNKYHEIIIDEYQDSNYVQELILSTVSKKSFGKYNRFMVGDIKQCIYKFRLANPDIFTEKYKLYSLNKSDKEIKIDLSKNFRSRKHILDGINFLFYQLMSEYIGEIDYDDNAALNYGADYPENVNKNDDESESIELFIIDSETIDIDSEELEIDENSEIYDEINDLKTAELEASFIANKIKEMIYEKKLKVYDSANKEYRNIEYKDIVILLRSTKMTSKIFSEILTKNGIASYADNNTGFFEFTEVMTILSLLQIIDNPRQDINLLTILYSSIYSFSLDDLIEIKTSSEFVSFYDNILFFAENNINEEISNKLNKFLDDLKKWRLISTYTPINELLLILYEETNYFNYVGTLTGGNIRQANLRALHEKAVAFEKTSLHGLFQFIKYIDKIKKNSSSDFGEAKIFSENENVVRIMSIHKSKGLEFPVVFVSLLGKKLNTSDSADTLLLHQNLGFGPTYVNLDNRIKIDTFAKYAISKKIIQETLSEELRILYVALTRAKEKLVLVGTVKNIKSKIDKWTNFLNYDKLRLPNFLMAKPYSVLDWIVPAVLRHRDGQTLYKDYNYFNNSGISELYNHESNWSIKVISRKDLIITKKERILRNIKLIDKLDSLEKNIDYSGYKEEIFNRLSWVYPYSIEQSLPFTISISEIKRLFSVYEDNDLKTDENIVFEPPKFISESGDLTNTQKGTAFHTVLETIDFNKKYSIDDLNKLYDEILNHNLLTEQELSAVNKSKILKFLDSPIAKRISNSKYVKKETSFSMGISANDVYIDKKYENVDSDIIVHGIVDLYFEENDDIILLDYKTDFVTEDTIKDIKNKYSIQINLYKKALEKSTGKKVSECFLYLFGIDKAVKY